MSRAPICQSLHGLREWKEAVWFYASFESFTAALEEYLADGIAVQGLFATGPFDVSTATITADCIEVKVK